jgi:hypothetical protein
MKRQRNAPTLDGLVRHSVSAGPSLREQAQAHIALLESHRMWDGHANDYTIDLLTRLVSALPNEKVEAPK